MSEGAPINANPRIGAQGRLGRAAVAGTEVEVVDLETGTRVMPVGERGEIRVRGPQFTTGYRNRPEENRQPFATAGSTPATSATSTTTATCSWSTARRS